MTRYHTPVGPALSVVEGAALAPPTPAACPEPVLSNAEGPSRRGGKRPGAGAPRGNLNALKHGQHSAQLRALILLFHAPALRLLIARLIRRQARRDRQLQRDAAAVGLWLQHLDPDDSPPPISLPRLTRRQTRLLADTLAHHLLRPPIQSTETAPKSALPDTPHEKNRRTQSNPPDSDPPPNARAVPRLVGGRPANSRSCCSAEGGARLLFLVVHVRWHLRPPSPRRLRYLRHQRLSGKQQRRYRRRILQPAAGHLHRVDDPPL